MITRNEVLKGQPCPIELEANLAGLLFAVNKLRAEYGKPMVVVSGYRTLQHNAKVGGARNSAHLFCQAIDILDVSRDLCNFITRELLEKCGLWMEDPTETTTWIHVQTRPAKHRVFKP